MRLLLATIVIVLVTCFAFAITSCNSSSGAATFCDTTCFKDSVKFENSGHTLRPFITISGNGCMADTIGWSYDGMGVIRKMDVQGLTGADVRLNKDFIRCVFNDTSYAYVLFNDCNGGRGYYLRIPFNKTANIGRSNRALNNFDPKFDVDDDLLAYIDPANILIIEMKTGKTALMTFGRDITPDYANIHNSIDTVNITPTRVWARYKIDNEWKELEKKIVLK